jgi:hypothetical protein
MPAAGDAAPLKRAEAPPFDAVCSRRLSREAVAIVESDVLLFAHTNGVKPAPSCVLDPTSSRYAKQEATKKAVNNGLWECGMCGKQFRSDWFLDWHLARKHAEEDTGDASGVTRGGVLGQDGVWRTGQCFADYCGLLGCPSLEAYEANAPDSHDDNGDAADEGEAEGAVGGGGGGDSEDGNEDEEGADMDGTGADGNDGARRPAAAAARRRGTLLPWDGSESVPGGASSAGLRDSEGIAQLTAPVRAQVRRRGQAGQDEAADDAHVHGDGVVHDPKTGARVRLTALQRRERDRCASILTACFPVPAEGEGDAGAGGTNQTEAAAVKRLRQRTPEPNLRERTLSVRRQLVNEFCETPRDVKKSRWAGRARSSAGMLVAYIVGGTFMATLAIFALFMYLDDNERQKKEAARLAGVRKGLPAGSRGSRTTTREGGRGVERGGGGGGGAGGGARPTRGMQDAARWGSEKSRAVRRGYALQTERYPSAAEHVGADDPDVGYDAGLLATPRVWQDGDGDGDGDTSPAWAGLDEDDYDD